jgi:arachidonate 15-lipoxygenase
MDTPPTVTVTGIVRAPIADVWRLFRPFGPEIMTWWPIYDSVELEPPGKDEVGAVRRFVTKTGRTYQEQLIERDDIKFRERYDMLSLDPAVPGFTAAATVVQMLDAGDGTTKITWESWSDVAPELLDQVKSQQTQAYSAAIAGLERHFESPADREFENLATVADALTKIRAKALELVREFGKGPQSTWAYGRYPRHPQIPDVPLEQLPRPVVGLPADQALGPKKLARIVETGLEYVYSQAELRGRVTAGEDRFSAHLRGYLPAPEHIIAHWKDDAELARQFTQGVGPMVIRRVTDIVAVPESMRGVTPGGVALTELIADRRLFLCDYEALAPLQRYRDMVFYAPYVLVYKQRRHDGRDRLTLAAIQLTRDEDRPNAVYTPNRTPPNRWLFAKMHVACADNQYHQWLFHLGYAHLAMEPVIIAWHNALPEGHVIRELLAPHTRDTIGINFLARQTLISDVAPFTDRTFSTGTAQALQMFLNAWQRYDFFARSFPRELEERGFNEARDDGLEDYYFRDDGFLVWNAIGEYTQGVVEASYANDAAVAGDPALQAWARETSDPDKAAIPGFPTAFSSRELLARTLQTLIWSFSAQHSAVNYGQYHHLAYVPNRPDSLFAPMPEGDGEIDLQVIESALPNPRITHFQISFAWILSMPSESPLTAVTAMATRFPDVHKRFMARLAKVSAMINARNRTLIERGEDPYPYLLPERVASSISI